MKNFVTVSDLEQGDLKLPIWALNGSPDSEVSAPGELHVGIPKINGTKIDDLYLPQSWLPVCLTDQIPRPQLLASSEFRNAVNNRLVVLITAEYAKEINNQEGASEERERLMEMKRAVREATSNRSIVASGAEIVNTQEISEARTEEAQVSASNELKPGFLMFAEKLESSPDIECLNAIRSRGRFTGREIKHLIKTFSDKPRTIEFLKAKLRK